MLSWGAPGMSEAEWLVGVCFENKAHIEQCTKLNQVLCYKKKELFLLNLSEPCDNYKANYSFAFY